MSVSKEQQLGDAVNKNLDGAMTCLLDEGCDVNTMLLNGKAMVHQSLVTIAANKRSNRVLRVLIARGADVNQVCLTYGTTPLHLAVKAGNAEGVQLLIAAGANVDLQDKNGLTALMMSCKHSYPVIFDILIAAHARIDLMDSGKRTAIFHACKTASLGMVNTLVDAQASLAALDEWGNTPLFYAVNYYMPSLGVHTVKRLLELNVDTSVVSDDRLTALATAQARLEKPFMDGEEWPVLEEKAMKEIIQLLEDAANSA